MRTGTRHLFVLAILAVVPLLVLTSTDWLVHWHTHRDRSLLARALWSRAETCPDILVLGSSATIEMLEPLNDGRPLGTDLRWFGFLGARVFELDILAREFLFRKCIPPVVWVEMAPFSFSGIVRFRYTDVLEHWATPEDLERLGTLLGEAGKPYPGWRHRVIQAPGASSLQGRLYAASLAALTAKHRLLASPLAAPLLAHWRGPGAQTPARGHRDAALLIGSLTQPDVPLFRQLALGSLEQTADVVRQAGGEVRIFTAPLHSELREALEKNQTTDAWCRNLQSIKKRGFPLLDINQSGVFSDSDFTDPLHLSAAGARQRIDAVLQLLQTRPDDPRPDKCLDPIEGDALP